MKRGSLPLPKKSVRPLGANSVCRRRTNEPMAIVLAVTSAQFPPWIPLPLWIPQNGTRHMRNFLPFVGGFDRKGKMLFSPFMETQPTRLTIYLGSKRIPWFWLTDDVSPPRFSILGILEIGLVPDTRNKLEGSSSSAVVIRSLLSTPFAEVRAT